MAPLRYTRADLDKILVNVNRAGERLEMRGAGSWTVGTLGGTYLYLTEPNSGWLTIKPLGSSPHSASKALLDFLDVLNTVIHMREEG